MDIISFLIIMGALYTGILINAYVKLTPEQVLTPITGTISLISSMFKQQPTAASKKPSSRT